MKFCRSIKIKKPTQFDGLEAFGASCSSRTHVIGMLLLLLLLLWPRAGGGLPDGRGVLLRRRHEALVVVAQAEVLVVAGEVHHGGAVGQTGGGRGRARVGGQRFPAAAPLLGAAEVGDGVVGDLVDRSQAVLEARVLLHLLANLKREPAIIITPEIDKNKYFLPLRICL